MKVYAVVNNQGKPIVVGYTKVNPFYVRRHAAEQAAVRENKSWGRSKADPQFDDFKVQEFTLVPTKEYEQLLRDRQQALTA